MPKHPAPKVNHKIQKPMFLPHIVVRFRPDAGVPFVDRAEAKLPRELAKKWRALCAKVGRLTLRRRVRPAAAKLIKSLIARAQKMNPRFVPPIFTTSFVVRGRPGFDAIKIATEIREWDGVVEAWAETHPPPLTSVNAADDPRQAEQIIHDPAPDGVDAEFAWRYGGNGAGITVADVERGWSLTHEDLVGAEIQLIHGVPEVDTAEGTATHGTAVLGIIGARDNGVGVVGIAPRCAMIVSSIWPDSKFQESNVPSAIYAAVNCLEIGDILLVEVSSKETSIDSRPGASSGIAFLPVEDDADVFNAIQIATGCGIIVICAAGNSGIDLGSVIRMKWDWLNSGYKPAYMRDSWHECGSIIVGAADLATRGRQQKSNFGDRIDCYGLEKLMSTGSVNEPPPDNEYAKELGQTSCAAAVIAGVAAVVQGLARANFGRSLSPTEMRNLLRDTSLGTPSANPAADQIGSMPDLRKIARFLFQIPADVYLRDSVLDVGAPHTEPVGRSPDILMLSRVPASLNQAFLQQEISNQFSVPIGTQRYIYLRVRNRGATPAVNVPSVVYQAPTASIWSPLLWRALGGDTFAEVPADDVPVISAPILWSTTTIAQVSENFSLITLLNYEQDPLQATLGSFDEFVRFVQANNNIAVRNYVPSNIVWRPSRFRGVLGSTTLRKFLAAGVWDNRRQMTFNVEATLPLGARLMLEIPTVLAITGPVGIPVTKSSKGSIQVPVSPRGVTEIGPLVFPVKSRFRCRIVVWFPTEITKPAGVVRVSQCADGVRLGAASWDFATDLRSTGHQRKSSFIKQ